MALPSRPIGNRAYLLPTHWKEHPPALELPKPPLTEQRHSFTTDRKAPVIYYLTRNGRLDHPHFMELILPSPGRALRLCDVLRRLNILRGKGIAEMYSWSYKRTYRNGFVWCDLAEGDPIYPVNGVEYVLKGSELPLEESPRSNACSAVTSGSSCDGELQNTGMAKPTARSLDVSEYRIVAFGSADASTQTDDSRREKMLVGVGVFPPVTDLDGSVDKRGGDGEMVFYGRGRARLSAVLVSLISCGAISMRAHGASDVDRRRFGRSAESVESIATGGNGSDGPGGLFPGFRRVSSCSADRKLAAVVLEVFCRTKYLIHICGLPLHLVTFTTGMVRPNMYFQNSSCSKSSVQWKHLKPRSGGNSGQVWT